MIPSFRLFLEFFEPLSFPNRLNLTFFLESFELEELEELEELDEEEAAENIIMLILNMYNLKKYS